MLNTYQARILAQKQADLSMSDGQLMDIARAISHNGTLISMAHLTRDQGDDLIRELSYIKARQELMVAA